MKKKPYRLHNRLDGDELEYLKKQLFDYRSKKQAEKELEEFYAQTRGQHSLDSLGRFHSYDEMGLERTVWKIYDETKNSWVAFAEGDKLILLDDQDHKIKKVVYLNAADEFNSDYFEMCSKLGIDAKDNYKHLVGLIYSDEFNTLMKKHPEFLEKLMGFTSLSEEAARTKIKNWFYTPNNELENFEGSGYLIYNRPIDVYRKQGPESLYPFFDKPDWPTTA